jgi:DNA-binding transcriptional ArsR family regulator
MNSAPLPEIDGRLTQAVSNPIRVAFLQMLADRKLLTTRDAARALSGRNIALRQISYHVRVLARLGLVEVAGPGRADGGVSFQATDTGELLMMALADAPEGGCAEAS